MRPLQAQTAGELVEVVPSITRAIREQMRQHRTSELTVTQFRVLAFINRHPRGSLSDVADHIGLTLPSMSKLIDQLVDNKVVVRESDKEDRRRITLVLTPSGETILKEARAATREYIAERMAPLRRQDLETVLAALQILRPLFATEREAQRTHGYK
jgi:MarR family transcriptional regulator for hemolysin